MFIKNLQRLRAKPGFTLVELVAVIAIIGILATVTIPVSVSLVRRGQQTNRTNIARNIYVLVQNHLTKSAAERTLKTTFTGYNFELNANGFVTDDFCPIVLAQNSVFQQLGTMGGEFPAEEILLNNEDNIRFISKPRGYVPGAGTPEQDVFFFMLESLILDGDILQEAILMEYNARTGNVLSIFYGNALQDEFTYMAADLENDSNITGPRGEEYHIIAIERRQGFFGVRETGVPPLVIGTSRDIANVYDGAERGLEARSPFGGSEIRNKVNVLYTEFILEGTGPGAIDGYSFELVCARTDVSIVPPASGASVATNFYSAVSSGSGNMIYHDVNRPVACVEVQCNDPLTDACTTVCQGFVRYVWVLDYFGEDELEMGNDISRSVFPSDVTPTNVRARATRADGVAATSLTVANTLFARELTSGNFEITTARHLNNVRHAMLQPCVCETACADAPLCNNKNFRQTVDINMARPENKISSFEPLGVLRGSYRALSVVGESSNSTQLYAITNLNISGGENTGLFNEVKGTVDGLILRNAAISGASGGAVAGTNSGWINRVVITESTIDMSSGAYAGGIAGINAAGALIRDSLVRGTNISGGAFTGGIAGGNYGISAIGADYGVKRSAVEDSFISGGSDIGGIVGFNRGDIADVYFLSTSRTTDFPQPIQSNGGGIAGRNYTDPDNPSGNGDISRALFIAPAPSIPCPANAEISACNAANCNTHIFPITREGDVRRDPSHPVNSFYLAGRNYSIGFYTDGENYNSSITSEFTVGHVNPDINSLSTDFLNKVWIDFAAGEKFTNWKEGPGTPEYPYPVLRVLSDLLPDPESWPAAGGRREISREPLGAPLSNSMFNLNFINGDFNAPKQNPITGIPLTGANHFNNEGVATDSTNTWRTGAANGHIAGNNNSFWVYYNPDFVQGWNIRPVDLNNYGRWRFDNASFTGTAGHATSYSNSANPAGWRNEGFGNFWIWNAFEYQRPINNGNAGRARRGYDGSMTRAYAELNPDIQSTLYQICQTEDHPFFSRGQQFYYSFHHITRTDAATIQTDTMSFYLTNIEENVLQPLPYSSDRRYHAGFTGLTQIRPCVSPRSQPPNNTDPNNSSSLWYNPVAGQTVNYGRNFAENIVANSWRGYNQSLRAYWDQNGTNAHSLPNHWDYESPSPFLGADWGQDVYVYDLWVGDSGIAESNNEFNRLNTVELFNATSATGTPVATWSVNPSPDTRGPGVTAIGAGNNVLRLEVGTMLNSVSGSGNLTLRINYLTGQNAGSARRMVAWTNLSADGLDAPQRSLVNDFAFANDSRRTGNRVIRSANFAATATSTTISIPRNLLISGSNRATHIYLILTTQGSGTNADTLFENQRGGIPNPSATNTRSGHGITFWSNYNLNFSTRGYGNIIDIANLIGNERLGLPSSATSDDRKDALERRIFSYWDVSYGWKQYYGHYTVPNGQVWTEFAFQSNSGSAQVGNYLAGVGFNNAPAHLSIETAFVRQDTGLPVAFVEPGDILRIEHLVQNLGTVPAGTIVVENPIAPFHELMDYIGNVTVTHNGSSVGAIVDSPSEGDDTRTLRITLPSDFQLAARSGETIQTLRITFDVLVRDTLLSEDGTSTWLYLIQSQGRVGFSDVFKEFVEDAPDKWNYSPVAEVSISQVRLSKDVVHKDVPGSRIDGPFTVNLTIINDGTSPAQGIITDRIPKGFSISNIRMGGMSVPFSRSVSGSGVNRQEQIIIPNVNLDPGSMMIFSYDLRNIVEPDNDSRFGVEFASEARYVYGSAIGRANAGFPQQVIGLTVKANNLTFDATGTNNALNIRAASGLDVLGDNLLEKDNYVVPVPEVVLLNSNSASDPVTFNQDGFITLVGPNYRIVLIGESIVVNASVNFSATIHYMLACTATKTNEPGIALNSEVRTITINYVH
ncbi:MAG: type II secretion system GspH family protein [Oscillospiraceae bacterium]|jgi:prepilin-type N-terminal cleavage/methylation domain-containing protein|nr:type II secretion system GspH family protein [Oscillospiraceae bacterium]